MVSPSRFSLPQRPDADASVSAGIDGLRLDDLSPSAARDGRNWVEVADLCDLSPGLPVAALATLPLVRRQGDPPHALAGRLRVLNPHGLHLRVAASISTEVVHSGCRCRFSHGSGRQRRACDGRSILELVMLAAGRDAEVAFFIGGRNAVHLLGCLALCLGAGPEDAASATARTAGGTQA